MVIWSEPARADLKHIYEFISNDSPYYARQVVQDVRERAKILREFPYIGKVVPELNNPTIRELHLYSYRIIYQLKNTDIHVLTVIHKRRDTIGEDLLR